MVPFQVGNFNVLVSSPNYGSLMSAGALLPAYSTGACRSTLRRPGLFESLRRDYAVTLAGPTTLLAILGSLQMGFRTLAIQKRSQEVWQLLGAVKTQFGKFGDLLAGVQKKLEEASNKIDDATKKSRYIERRLGQVQELPASEVAALLPDEVDPET